MFTKTHSQLPSLSALPQRVAGPSTAATPRNDVFVNGKYVGSDPDPTIRSTLARDSGVE